MDNTPFSKKCEILHDVYMHYSDNEDVIDFLDIFDLGVPLAMLIIHDACIPNEKGIEYINDAWQGLCDMLKCDADAEYDSAQNMIDKYNAKG